MMLDKTTKALYFLGSFGFPPYFQTDLTMRLTDSCKLLCPAAILLALLAGCAPQPLPSYSQGDQPNLTVEMRRMQGALSSQERSLQALDQQVADLNARVELQQKELDRLHRQVTLTAAGTAPLQPAMSSAEMTRSTEVSQVAAELEGTPTDIYLRAFGDYANGRYAAAILGFKSFLQNFPNNSYASNAQFWLADSYFKQQLLPAAIEEFNKLLQLYPRAPKAPDALLKIATAQLQLDKPEQARETLETLSRRHPESPAAQKAETLVLP